MIPKFRIWSNDLKEMYVQSDLLITLSHSGIDVVHFDSFYEFKDYVLMQSTSLHDKNGKEIFEGDIVKYWENIGYIEFYQGSWVINWNDGSLFDLYDNDNNLEVLGNIHEHPELLIQPK